MSAGIDKTTVVHLDGRQVSTWSREWQMVCLARHICRMPTRGMRQGFIAQLKWTPDAINELRRLTTIEWQRMYPNNQNKAEVKAHGNA